jgi:hypothetical protein
MSRRLREIYKEYDISPITTQLETLKNQLKLYSA